MSNGDTIQRLDIVELRLFIEELACSICRFMHASQDGGEPQSVRIKQEVQLGTPNAFADIVVRAPGMAPYIVEVDYGYSLERIAESLSRKYQRELGWFKSISKLILIFDRDNHPDDQEIEKHVRTLIPINWQLELWDEYRLMVTSTARRCHSFGCCRGPKGPDSGLPREGKAVCPPCAPSMQNHKLNLITVTALSGDEHVAGPMGKGRVRTDNPPAKAVGHWQP